ncbi:Cobalamin biosynthesis protein CobD [Methanimicrococcus sp. At1]|uniref:Probable cobalamin biosynthesis protein CobD n=1 Tax=Methanimicrococcus hacksteinii TaxID=3028293 RepID=A0ABU3VPE3_9EURY|nr:cobalamin biosynthesis protein [Methanimicrococcus sp. At1]MDV0444775.1 Cobalamin biosynthesis protein CobD [Methanimicrococcus sp. At1]
MVFEFYQAIAPLHQYLSDAFTYAPTELILVLLLAILIDLVFGEPPSAVHPVVWIGKLIGFLKSKAPKTHRKAYGIAMALTVIAFAVLLGICVVLIAHWKYMPYAAGLLIQAFFLKATFAVKCMVQPAKEIQDKLDNDIETVRKELITYVSRDTSKLSKSQIVSAVVESISENYVDAMLTPVFFYVVLGPFGLPAAYLFKAASTLDSMVGYKNEKYIQLGWFSAKFDDFLNWIPARLSPIFIAVGAGISNFMSGNLEKLKPIDGLKCAFRENKATPSPNSGWPMAAAAGALQIRFEKPDTYIIGGEYREPEAADISRVSILIILTSVITAAAGCLAIAVLWYAASWI